MPGPDAAAAAARLTAEVPATVDAVLGRLRRHGHAAYVVGGSLRDALLHRTPADWDLATDARPPEIVELFPGAVYENRFGTVAVRRDGGVFEITTFRVEHEYADHRRPHRVEFGDDLAQDLSRRDFTVNAMAWGGPAIPASGEGSDPLPSGLVDPFDGLGDLAAGRLRAVGDPSRRFHEDALRMIRAVRLAATLDLSIEPATLAAIAEHAQLAAHLSGERVGAELSRLLEAPRPSAGLRLAADTGLLAVVIPELAAQRGVAQNKVPGEDLWDHTLRTVDAAPRHHGIVRLAALLHDVGKPATQADGRFHHHDAVGAVQAESILRRLRVPGETVDEVVQLVRQHMFTVDPAATDVAIRRFIQRVGRERVDALFELRRADDIGSGLAPDDPATSAFRARVDAQLAARPPLDRHALAVDGDDLMAGLGLEPGPRLGRMLDALLDRVVDDPALNDRGTLLLLAQGMLADMPDDEAEA